MDGILGRLNWGWLIFFSRLRYINDYHADAFALISNAISLLSIHRRPCSQLHPDTRPGTTLARAATLRKDLLNEIVAGGVYIGGGITPKLLPHIQASASKGGSLLEGFLCPKVREPFRSLLQSMPLAVITNEKVSSCRSLKQLRCLEKLKSGFTVCAVMSCVALLQF